MHTAIPYEEEILDRLAKHAVTYLHPELIKTGNPSGQIMHAELEELEALADRLDGGKPCITN